MPGLILLPAAADQLEIPIVASGGFGDGRGLVAALALGAEAINMGTRFMATVEAPVHDAVKQALVGADERNTVLINRPLRNTSRIFRNGIAEKVIETEKARGKDLTIEDLAPFIAGGKGRLVFEEGDLEAGIFSTGQVVGLIRDVPTCEQLVSRIVGDAEAIIADRLAATLDRHSAAA